MANEWHWEFIVLTLIAWAPCNFVFHFTPSEFSPLLRLQVRHLNYPSLRPFWDFFNHKLQSAGKGILDDFYVNIFLLLPVVAHAWYSHHKLLHYANKYVIIINYIHVNILNYAGLGLSDCSKTPEAELISISFILYVGMNLKAWAFLISRIDTSGQFQTTAALFPEERTSVTVE
jgi:hypothetical protein